MSEAEYRALVRESVETLARWQRFAFVMTIFAGLLLFGVMSMGMAYRESVGAHHEEFRKFRDSQLEFNAAQADFNIAVSKELENAKP